MVSLVSLTEPGEDLKSLGISTAEDLIVYVARVSNPSNQTNMQTAPRLLKYLITHKHWSPFEHVAATLRISTSRAMAAQILRHRSFTFQEFSQRYSEVVNLEPIEFRSQGKTNRQVGDEAFPMNQHQDLQTQVNELQQRSLKLYNDLITVGVAKECARMVLPLNSQTTIYMTGTLRSWIHYIQLRNTPETQKEHREIAFNALKILVEQFPVTFKILDEMYKYDQ
jgi:thymidylate synthase (FAD)